MSPQDRLASLTTYAGQAAAQLDNLVREADAIMADPFMAKPHPKLVEARQNALNALTLSENAARNLAEILAPVEREAISA